MGLLDSMPEVVMVPAGDDPWSAVALRAEAYSHAKGWHSNETAPTGLYWLYQKDDVGGLGPAIAVGTPDLPPGMDLLHPVPLLEGLEQRMLKPPRDLVGFVVVVEAWMVVANRADPVATALADELAEQRRLRDHPGRIEVRVAHLITTLPGLDERVVMRRRGQEPHVFPVGPDYDGASPHAIRSLAKALRRRRYGRKG